MESRLPFPPLGRPSVLRWGSKTVRIFRHYVPMPLLVLAFAEAAILFGSVYAGVSARFFLIEADLALHSPIGQATPVYLRAIVFTVVMMGVMTAFGLYRWDARETNWGYYGRFIGSLLVGVVALVVVFYLVPHVFVGRGAFALTFLFAAVGTATARYIFVHAFANQALKRRILVLGTGARAAEIQKLAKNRNTHFQVVGYIPFRNEVSAVSKAKEITDKDPLITIVKRYDIDEIVVGLRDRRRAGLSMQELLECKLEGVHIVDLSSFFERESGHVQLDSVNTSWMVFSDGFRRNALRDVNKRIFDIAVSGLLFVITLPVMVVTGLLIAITSGRPILYRQERVGECGHPFNLLKFRSMRTDAERNGPQWAKQNDDRVTAIGRFIRQTRIDELPQLLNVLRGDMSFVGPRPERAFFVRQLSAKIPYYPSRHAVKPGITGWAQIRYPYGSSVEDAHRKLQYDLYYVKNHTVFLDLIILLQTMQVVLFGRGAR